ncbi:MAG TPA: CocE/NonD family hydrolase [Actinomycetota bacterium]|nr:CocE/NonD family hydrolase [Actinomycetota bacterium]
MTETFQWIPMSDGARLAATLYLPATEGPQPAILEALPYRKDDVTAYNNPEYRRLRDEGGYAVCRVDVRGTGSSDGLAVDEYPAQEQRDMCEVIAWLAAQPWCSGRVGMYGTSYSGFNSIQVAMQRPPALGAICTIFSTDDRYTDDVHYGGGIRRALDLVDYPLYMVAMNALPPVPRVAGEGWRRTWAERVENLEPWILRWLEEQVDGPYWRHGSLRPHYDAIRCATLIVAGWADGYHNMTWRTFEGLRCPKRMLIGPWAHTSTETSKPGPRIDLVPEMIRWWDRWLRGARNGIDDEPPITVYARRSTRPAGDLDRVRGVFRFEAGWPLERARADVMPLSDAIAVGRGDAPADDLWVRGDVGATASIWCAGGGPFGQPLDQRPDEALSLVYDWPPLEEELEILGYPRVELRLSSSEPVAFVSLKLCDVFEDGTSALVSRTAFNLTHRRSHAEPEPLEPGAPHEVTVELDATSWTFERGHRVRLDVAGADWPNVWPPPAAGRLTVHRDGSALVLPAVGPPPPSPEPSLPPSRPGRDRPPPGPEPTWRIEHDVVARVRRVVIAQSADSELEVGGRLTERYSGHAGVSTEDPADAWVEGRARYELSWPETAVTSESRLVVRSDKGVFRVELDLEVGEGGAPRWARRWERTIPRRLA